MSEESRALSKRFKLHVVNLVACVAVFLSLMGFFLVAMHMQVVFSETERVGLFGLIATAVGGAIYSAKQLPGKTQ